MKKHLICFISVIPFSFISPQASAIIAGIGSVIGGIEGWNNSNNSNN